jgi:putative redox protein
VEIRTTFKGGHRVDADFDGFVVHTDHSRKDGGEGSAPAPWQLFLASIATCVGAYVLDACRERNLPSEGIEVRLREEYEPAGERLAKVGITIVVPPVIGEQDRAALVRAAARCAVKKAISDPPAFQITAVSAP